MIENLNKLDQKLRDRLSRVVLKARQFNERGIVEWAERAAADALFLGKLRDRDNATLARLEDTFGHDFYNRSYGDNSVYA